MKTLSRIAFLLILLAVTFAAHAQESGEATLPQTTTAGSFALKSAPVDELSRLCPKGALVFARLNNPKALDAAFAAISKLIDPADSKDASLLKNIGWMTGNPDLTGVDKAKPFGMALFMGDAGPTPVVLLPLADKAAFQAKTDEKAGHVYVGNYAIWAENKDLATAVKPAEVPTRLAASLMHGDFAVGVDMDVARPMFEPLFEQMDGFVEMMRQMAPGPAGDFYAGLASQMKTALSDADQVGLAMDWKDGVVEVASRYSAKEGTASAKDIAAEKITSETLLGLVNRSGFMAMEMRTSGESMWRTFGSLYEGMLEGAGPEALAMLKKSFSLMRGMAFGMSFEGGLNGVSVTKITDEAEYEKMLEEMPKLMTSFLDAYKKMMPPGIDFPMDMELSVGTVWEYAGVKVRPYSMKMSILESAEMPPEALAAMKEMFTAMFGGESLDFQYAIVSGHAVGTIGSKAAPEIRGLIERVKAGDLGRRSPALLELTRGFPGETTSLFAMDFAGILKLVADMKTVPLPDPIRENLRAAPAGLGFSGFSTNDGTSLGVGLRVDLMKIIRFAKSFD